MRGVIYKYTNLINGKVYIGQTLNEKKRREKWNNLSAPYAGIYINRARAKYGLSSFSYETITEVLENDEDILRSLLNTLEAKYISLYNSTDERFGYNLSSGGGQGRHQIVTEEARANMSKAQKGLKKKMSDIGRKNISMAHRTPRPWTWKKVAQYDKDTGKLIKVWNSISEVINYFGGKGRSSLICAIQRKYRHKYFKGYIWKYY